METRNRLVLALVVTVSVFLIGTVGYMVIEHVDFGDAAYMTAITVSTVGFGEVFPLSAAGRLWTALIIFFGIAAVFTAFGTLTAMIVQGEVGRMMGSRKLHAKIDQLSDHIIICGYGRMGSLLANELLHRHVPIVVIDNDPQRTRELEQIKALYVLGDAAEEETLHEAGVQRARGLVAVLPHDSDNVFVTLTARGLRKDLIIVARGEQLATESKLLRAGATRVISPHAIGATRIANVLTRPHVVDVLDVAAKGVDLEMDEFVVTRNSLIRGKTLREAALRQRANVMVVAIKHADQRTTFNPGPETILGTDDTIITIGPAGGAAKLKDLQLDEP